MRAFFSSTLLLGTATVIHALRIVVLSLLLGNTDFGAVSTILLMMTLFAEFGALGYSQLIYNQPLFEPGRVTRHSRRVGLYFVSGLFLLMVTALAVAIVAANVSPFSFVPIFLTLFCAAANMMVLSACRSSRSSFTHPGAYFLKALLVVTDIVILGFFTTSIAHMALWGEVIALPVLLFYAWRVGILKLRWTIVREVPGHLSRNMKLGMTAIASAMSGMAFFNQERLFGTATLTLEQLGVLTKLLLPKMIAAQGAFLLGVHFHRLVVGMTAVERQGLFARIRRLEWLVLPALALAVAIGGYCAVYLNDMVYGIAINYQTGVAVTVLALMFFFNPYSIMLQATNRYGALAIANVVAVSVFSGLMLIADSRGTGVAALSALSACVWFLTARIMVGRSFSSRVRTL